MKGSSGAKTAEPMPDAAHSTPVPRPRRRLNHRAIPAMRGTMKMTCAMPRSIPKEKCRLQRWSMKATSTRVVVYKTALKSITLRAPNRSPIHPAMGAKIAAAK